MIYGDYWDRVMRELKRAERPGSPDEIHVRAFKTNWGDPRYLVEGRKLGVHLGDRSFPTHADALVYAKMIASWEGAKLVDHVGRGG